MRGQKLPIFSVAGLPHLELAAQIAAQSTAGAEPFSVVFAAMGLTHADTDAIRDTLDDRLAAGELLLLLNTADDPVIERILTPRIALTVAEHLAFELDRHVLVVLADMTSYAEALREVSAARGELPGRRAYPGYLYSDLATLYERCGRIRGRSGSVTVLPVLTMPAGDITHPVPDLTGYITEGQIVLSPEVHARGIYPPVDALASLSRLMRNGAGPGRTREDHLELAAQLLAALARARQVRELAEIVGDSALSATDQLYLEFATRVRAGTARPAASRAARDGPDPRPVLGRRERAAAARADDAAPPAARRPPPAEGMTPCRASQRCPPVVPAAAGCADGWPPPSVAGSRSTASCASCSRSSNGCVPRRSSTAPSGCRPAPTPTAGCSGPRCSAGRTASATRARCSRSPSRCAGRRPWA